MVSIRFIQKSIKSDMRVIRINLANRNSIPSQRNEGCLFSTSTLFSDKLADGIPDLLLMPYQEVTAGFIRHQLAAGDTFRDKNCSCIGRRRIVLRMNNQHRDSDLLNGKGLINCEVRDIHVKQDTFRPCGNRQRREINA